MFHVASFWWGHPFSSFIYSPNITRCFTGPTWPSFVLISLAEYLTKWCDLLQQLLSRLRKSSVSSISWQNNHATILCYLLRVITPHWRRNTIYFLKNRVDVWERSILFSGKLLKIQIHISLHLESECLLHKNQTVKNPSESGLRTRKNVTNLPEKPLWARFIWVIKPNNNNRTFSW